jgi:hypothetical protein
MVNMKNARLSAGMTRIKTPPRRTILKRRFDMKLILSAAAMAVLLAAPAMAQQGRPHGTALPNAPKDARGSVATNGVNEGGPYTPSIPTLIHSRNRDFQNGSRD